MSTGNTMQIETQTARATWPVATTVSAALCVLLTGCAGFGGQREIAFKLACYGVSLEWSSSVTGTYPVKPVEAPKQPAP